MHPGKTLKINLQLLFCSCALIQTVTYLSLQKSQFVMLKIWNKHTLKAKTLVTIIHSKPITSLGIEYGQINTWSLFQRCVRIQQRKQVCNLLKNIMIDIRSKCNKITDYYLKHGYSIFKTMVLCTQQELKESYSFFHIMYHYMLPVTPVTLGKLLHFFGLHNLLICEKQGLSTQPLRSHPVLKLYGKINLKSKQKKI